MNLGKAIKEIREAAGLSLEQLEQKCGRKAAYLEKVEAGQITPDDSDVRTISEALGIPKQLLPVIAIERSDVQKGKEEIFDTLFPSLKELALSLITKTE